MSRRMFNQDIVESDAFLDMPISSQALYFHLGMDADDDGFVNPKRIMRLIGVSDDDLKVLLTKRFLLPFESGVVVIKHWLIHNLIRADLYKETLYKKEKSLLGLNEIGAYTELREGVSEIKEVESPQWLRIRRGEKRAANVPQTVPRLGKGREGKDSKSCPSDENKVPNIPELPKKEKIDVSKTIDFWNSLGDLSALPKVTNPKNTTAKKKLLTKCLGVTEPIELAFEKLGKYSEADFQKAIISYVKEILNRSPENDYANHRFSFYEFFKQENGFIKFLNS